MNTGKFFVEVIESLARTFFRMYYQNPQGAKFLYHEAISMADGFAFDRDAEFVRTFCAIPHNAKEVSFVANVPCDVLNAQLTTAYKLGSTIEENGYDDSDWVAPYFMPETKSIEVCLVNSTRFAGGFSEPADIILTPTKEIAELVADLLYLEKLPLYVKADKATIENPFSINIGQSYILKEKHAPRNVFTVCGKCNGTGAWVNPKNENDKRECFACYASGVVKTQGKANKLEIGLTGTAIAYTKQLVSFRNEVTTVTLKTDSGFVRVPLDKLSENRSVDFTACDVSARKSATHFDIFKSSGYSRSILGNIAASALAA